MAPYWSIDLSYVFFALGIGLIISLLVCLARATPWLTFTFRRRTDRQIEDDFHEFGGGVTERNRPIPLLIWVVLVGYFLWAAGYVVLISSTGY